MLLDEKELSFPWESIETELFVAPYSKGEHSTITEMICENDGPL